MIIAPPAVESATIPHTTVLVRGIAVPEELLGQRVVDKRFAGLVRQLMHDVPEVRPMRHAHADRPSGAGLRHVAPPGAYSAIRAVTRQEWLAGVEIVLTDPATADVLRRNSVSSATMKMWAQCKTAWACKTSGRGCIVTPEELASVMGVEERQAQRANAAARQLGLEIVVETGRMLKVDERAAAQATGSRQRGFASEVALTLPRHVLVDVPFEERTNRATSVDGRSRSVHSDTPSRGPQLDIKGANFKELGDAASGSGTTETPPASPPEKDQPRRRRSKRDPRATTLAFALIKELAWLSGEQPGRLAPCLTRFASAEWTARDVCEALQFAAQRTGKADPTRMLPDDVRTRPAALLAHLMRNLDPINDWPATGRMFPHTEVTCANLGCDHGWINLDDGRARRCPDCPTTTTYLADNAVDPWNDDDPLHNMF